MVFNPKSEFLKIMDDMINNKIQKVGFIRKDNILDRIKNIVIFSVFKDRLYLGKLTFLKR